MVYISDNMAALFRPGAASGSADCGKSIEYLSGRDNAWNQFRCLHLHI